MITELMVRDNGGIHRLPPRQRMVQQSVLGLIQYELGYGGVITAASTTSLSVQTNILGAIDNTEFTGPEDEILKLLQAADMYLKIRPKQMTNYLERIFENDDYRSLKARRPLYLANAAALALSGSHRVFVGVLLAVFSDMPDEELIAKYDKVKLDDIVAALELVATDPSYSIESILN